MKKIKIIFMGTPEIAQILLKRLLDDGYSVIGVVSQPDKKVGRKQVLSMSKVKECALEHGIPVFQPLKIKEDYQELMQLGADLIVTCAYGQFVPQELLDSPTFGSINVHASLLPKLRGGAPIHKAIINGDKETGMSIMRMVKAMDAGAVMAQCVVPIEPDDITGDMYAKLAIAGANLLSESIPKIIEGTAVFVEQSEEEVTFAYTIQKEEEKIKFDEDVQCVYNHLRGLLPTPVGYAILDGKKVKFHNVRMLKATHSYKDGELVGLLEAGIAIATQGGYIIVDTIQMEGKAKSDATSFYNGIGRRYLHQCFE